MRPADTACCVRRLQVLHHSIVLSVERGKCSAIAGLASRRGGDGRLARRAGFHGQVTLAAFAAQRSAAAVRADDPHEVAGRAPGHVYALGEKAVPVNVNRSGAHVAAPAFRTFLLLHFLPTAKAMLVHAILLCDGLCCFRARSVGLPMERSAGISSRSSSSAGRYSMDCSLAPISFSPVWM